MGLASKLAATQAGGGGGGGAGYNPSTAPPQSYAPPAGQQGQSQPQQSQQPQQQATGSYPGQQAYQPYSASSTGQQNQQRQGYDRPGQPQQQQYGQASQQYGAPPAQTYGAPPSQQYGAPPSQQQGAPPPQYGGQQQQYGGGSNGGPQETQAYKTALEQAVREKGLERFYPQGSPDIERIAQQAASKVDQVCQRWNIPKEVARDIARLGLYDIVLYVDDSGSMQFEENGERIDDLKLILQRVSFASTLFDQDGISIRFMNSVLPESMVDNVNSEAQIDAIMRSVKFSGTTPMGRELKRKVIDGVVLRDARQGRLKKPVLVITITDGQPAGDEPGPKAIFDVIKYAVAEVGRASGSRGGISFQFAQVGNDTKAREFLGRLDTDPSIGDNVDCTSNFEQEQLEMLNQTPPVDLTPDLWMVKLLLGAIDPSYDSKDESRSYRPGGAPAAGGHPQGGPQGYAPQGQYQQSGPPQGGAPGGGYGGPPSGQQYAPQSQGQYGQGQGAQYNRPAPPPGGQGGYGGQSGGYPGAGGYSAPPPPPRY